MAQIVLEPAGRKLSILPAENWGGGAIFVQIRSVILGSQTLFYAMTPAHFRGKTLAADSHSEHNSCRRRTDSLSY